MTVAQKDEDNNEMDSPSGPIGKQNKTKQNPADSLILAHRIQAWVKLLTFSTAR